MMEFEQVSPEFEAEAETVPELETELPSELGTENIPICVAVELSQMRLTIAELGALKGGDVLELNKGPGELVDLVVSGRLIAKGELVDIDGELGVRIRSLVK